MNKMREQIIWHRMKKLLRDSEIPDGHEAVRKARIELGMPEFVSGATTAPRNLPPTFPSPFSLRRGLVCLSVLFILFGFFTMTEAGAAFAKGIYNVVVSVFGGSLLSRNESAPDHVKPIDFAALPAEFESMQAVAEATERQIVIPGSNDGTLLSFSTHMIGQEMLVVKSRYAVDGKEYAIVQSLYNDLTLWGGYYNAADNVITMKSGIEITTYLSIMEDETVYAEAFGTGYDINVSSTELSLDELKEIIGNLKLMD